MTCALEGVAGTGCVVRSATLRVVVPLYRVHAPRPRGALRVHGVCVGFPHAPSALAVAAWHQCWERPGAPLAALPRGSNLGVREHVRGAEPAPPWPPRAPAARIRKQPDVRGITLVVGGRHLLGSDTSRTPTPRVSRTAISCLGTGRGGEHGRGEGGAREQQRRRRILQFTSRRAFGRNSIQTTLGPSWPQFFPSLRFSRGNIDFVYACFEIYVISWRPPLHPISPHGGSCEGAAGLFVACYGAACWTLFQDLNTAASNRLPHQRP
jgi:hypothetical protein